MSHNTTPSVDYEFIEFSERKAVHRFGRDEFVAKALIQDTNYKKPFEVWKFGSTREEADLNLRAELKSAYGLEV